MPFRDDQHIIITYRISKLQTETMHNYQFYQYNFFAHTPNYYYYTPIINFDTQQPQLQSLSFNTFLDQNHQITKGKDLPQQKESHIKGQSNIKIKNEAQDLQIKGKGHGKQQNQILPKSQMIHVANRNILPNILNLVLSYIRRINKSGKMVFKIIKRLTNNSSLTVKKFYGYQSFIKERVPFHKSKHTLTNITQHIDLNFDIFSLEEQHFYNKVCRILIAHFLKEQYLTTLLSSGKIHRTNKNDHLKIRRYLQLKIEKAGTQRMEIYRMFEK